MDDRTVSDKRTDIIWGPSIRSRLAEERSRRARAANSLASLANQTGPYAEEHRRLIAMSDEIIAVVKRHGADVLSPPTAALSRAMGGGDDLMQTIADICRPVKS